MDKSLDKVAARFLRFLNKATGMPVIVCDEQGVIRQATVASRVGTLHDGAKRIMEGEADELFVTAEDVARDPRMKEGCNCAIEVDGVRLGTFGIAGPADISRPLARVAASVIGSWVRDQRKEAELSAAAHAVVQGFKRVNERSQALEREAAEVTQAMTRASTEVAERVTRSAEATRAVQDVARLSRILSINGTVEASRAGEQGRGFAVVASEMLKLAEQARTTAGEIETSLRQIQASVAALSTALERSGTLAQENRAALAEVTGVMEGLRRTMAELTKR